MKIYTKKYIIFVLITILSFLIIGCSKKTNENAYKYISDIDYLDSNLKLHPNSFINDEISQEDFDNKIDEIKNDINNKDMSDFDINYRIKEIFSMAKDGHACFYDSQELLERDRYFPFLGHYFDNDYYIVSCLPELIDREQLLGSKLISINNISMKEIEERYDKIVSNDNSQWLKVQITSCPFSESAFKYF